MSADKDRGIRRQKQKRAKVMKKEARAQHVAAVAQAAHAGEASSGKDPSTTQAA